MKRLLLVLVLSGCSSNVPPLPEPQTQVCACWGIYIYCRCEVNNEPREHGGDEP